MTLKLEGDLDILKMWCLHTESEVARLRYLKLLMVDEICMANEKTKIALEVKVKCHQLPTTSIIHHGTYSYQVTSISDEQLLRLCADRQTDAQTTKNNTCSKQARR